MKHRLALLALALATCHPAAADPIGLTPPQTQALREGRGMGLSLPAELNGYPGPRHVLELAEPLGLTPEQRRASTALVDDMQRDAAALGARIVARESDLDALFAAGRPEPARLDALVGDIGRLNAELRLIHLRSHLAETALLSPEQVAGYMALRHGR